MSGVRRQDLENLSDLQSLGSPERVLAAVESLGGGGGDAKGGAAGGAMNLLQFPGLNHQCDITRGVREEECRAMLLSFFSERRAANKATKAQPALGSHKEAQEGSRN